MATSVSSRPVDKQYLGNDRDGDDKEFHDLQNEDTAGNGCQIDEIEKMVTFDPDTAATAISEGFDPCAKCQEGSTQ